MRGYCSLYQSSCGRMRMVRASSFVCVTILANVVFYCGLGAHTHTYTHNYKSLYFSSLKVLHGGMVAGHKAYEHSCIWWVQMSMGGCGWVHLGP